MLPEGFHFHQFNCNYSCNVEFLQLSENDVCWLLQPYLLEGFRSKQEKLELLDMAISTRDGNAITAVRWHSRTAYYHLLF